MALKYEYTLPDNPEGLNTFAVHKYDLAGEGPVEAIYTPSAAKIGTGNPFIEALPRPRTTKELILDFTSGVKGFDRTEILRSTQMEQIQRLSDLYTFRVPLLNERKLEAMIYNCLVQSYAKRRIHPDPENYSDLKYCESNQEYESKISTYGDLDFGVDAGIAYLGYAGSGKSHSIKRTMKHIPQVLIHSFPEDGIERATQITYLMTECMASRNSDFGSLLDDIAASVDRALGNRNHFYRKEMEKKRKLDDKISFVEDLIETFAIGIIIIDEIEVLDPNKNAKETYSKLLRLTNKTKVNFVFVGTEDSFNKMFYDLKMHRRFHSVDACGYCEDKVYYQYIMSELLRYQFCDPIIPVLKPDGESKTTEFYKICDAFYECTHGIIGLTIGLYDMVNFEYLRNPVEIREEITPVFVKNVSNEYFPGIRDIVKKLNNPLAYESILNSMEQAEEKKNAKIKDMEEQDSFKNDIIKSAADDKMKKIRALKDNMLHTLTACKGDLYKEETILKAILRVLEKDGAENYKEIEATREAVKVLEKMPIDLVRKKKRKTNKKDDSTNLFGKIKE